MAGEVGVEGEQEDSRHVESQADEHDEDWHEDALRSVDRDELRQDRRENRDHKKERDHAADTQAVPAAEDPGKGEWDRHHGWASAADVGRVPTRATKISSSEGT